MLYTEKYPKHEYSLMNFYQVNIVMELAPISRNISLGCFYTLYIWHSIICTLLGLASFIQYQLCEIHLCYMQFFPILSTYDYSTVHPFYSWWTVNVSTLGLLQIVLQLTFFHLSFVEHVFTFPKSRITGLENNLHLALVHTVKTQLHQPRLWPVVVPHP